MTATPLLYSPALAAATLKQYALGLFVPEDTDLVVFEAQGGVVQRELAIPFLPGMDSVVVERAQLQLRSRPRDMEVEFDARPGSRASSFSCGGPRLLSIAVDMRFLRRSPHKRSVSRCATCSFGMTASRSAAVTRSPASEPQDRCSRRRWRACR